MCQPPAWCLCAAAAACGWWRLWEGLLLSECRCCWYQGLREARLLLLPEARAPCVVNTLGFVPGQWRRECPGSPRFCIGCVSELSPLRGSAAGCRYHTWAWKPMLLPLLKTIFPFAFFPGETSIVLCRRGKGISERRGRNKPSLSLTSFSDFLLKQGLGGT